MTRETKIGMLVGLAFIIVIGILLSDHMTSTNDPPKAPLASAGDAVRLGTTTPAPAEVPTTTMVIPPPAPPVAPTPTLQDLNAPPAPVAVQDIRVGPGAGQTAPQAISIQGGQPAPGIVQPGVESSPVIITQAGDVQAGAPIVPSDPTTPTPAPAGADALENWAAAHPAQLEVLGQPGQTPTPQPAPMAAVREYTVVKGDSLSKMASRLMGGNTKANRDAIVKANPSLHKNPDRVIVGRTYIIPTPAGAATAAAPAPAPAPVQRVAELPLSPAPQLASEAAPAPAPAANAEGHYWYTVKDNDNLWKIAADQLGSGNEWSRIKDMNKDILKGGDTVHPNMRLRLPGKGSGNASASAS